MSRQWCCTAKLDRSQTDRARPHCSILSGREVRHSSPGYGSPVSCFVPVNPSDCVRIGEWTKKRTATRLKEEVRCTHHWYGISFINNSSSIPSMACPCEVPTLLPGHLHVCSICPLSSLRMRLLTLWTRSLRLKYTLLAKKACQPMHAYNVWSTSHWMHALCEVLAQERPAANECMQCVNYSQKRYTCTWPSIICMQCDQASVVGGALVSMAHTLFCLKKH